MTEGEPDFDAMLAGVAERATKVLEQKDNATADEAMRARFGQDIAERSQALQRQRSAFDGLARLGVPDYVMNIGKSDTRDVTEVSQATERAQEAVEVARAELGRLQQHLMDQLQKLIDSLNNILPTNQRLDDIGDAKPEDYVSYIGQHDLASRSMSDEMKNYFTGRFAAVRDAEHQLRKTEVALERIVGPADKSGLENTDLVKQYMHEIAESRDIIVRTEQNPYVMDAVWGKPGEVAVDEDGKAKIIKEGESGEAEHERQSRDKFTTKATNAIVRKLGIDYPEGNNKLDNRIYKYYEKTFNKFLDEEVGHLQTIAPNFRFAGNDENEMSRGFLSPRDPSFIYLQSFSRENQAPVGLGVPSEQLAMMLGYQKYPHTINTVDRSFVKRHISTLQRFKALAEVDAGKYGVFPHATQWNSNNSHDIAHDLRHRGLHVKAGEALVPDEWMTDPTKKAEIEAANVEYQAVLKSAKEAVTEHQKRTVSDLQKRLDDFTLEIEYVNRTTAEIDLLNSEGMPSSDKDNLEKLKHELQQLKRELNAINSRKTGFLARYSKEQQNQDYSRIAAEIITKEQQIVDCEKTGEANRAIRVGQIIDEQRSNGVYYGSNDQRVQNIAELTRRIEGARSLLIELGS